MGQYVKKCIFKIRKYHNMKKTILFIIAFLGFAVAGFAQERPKKSTRPVTQKETGSAEVKQKAEPTAEGQRNKQKAEEEIRKRRAEKRAKMEQAKKDIREKIASDTATAK